MGFMPSSTNRGSNGFQAYSGGHDYFQLTPAHGTAAQLIKAGAGRVAFLHNPQGGTAAIAVYDAGSADATTLSSAVVLYSGTLPSGPMDLGIPTMNGIVVQANPAVDNPVLVGFV